ncbi:hypothetical protein FTX61_05210 [Nitriliruptoraceae bacterium ZYF776]|nr:hypothetical protein [Profundirhabdus halotolerans]
MSTTPSRRWRSAASCVSTWGARNRSSGTLDGRVAALRTCPRVGAATLPFGAPPRPGPHPREPRVTRTPLPPVLPTSLVDYAPGRIHLLPPERWPLRDARIEPTGVRIEVPRYALQVWTEVAEVDPERVRWLTERTTTRPLEARNIHLVPHTVGTLLCDGHTALAAHLATGSDHIPARLYRIVRG